MAGLDAGLDAQLRLREARLVEKVFDGGGVDVQPSGASLLGHTVTVATLA
jgi:hypothetical protein